MASVSYIKKTPFSVSTYHNHKKFDPKSDSLKQLWEWDTGIWCRKNYKNHCLVHCNLLICLMILLIDILLLWYFWCYVINTWVAPVHIKKIVLLVLYKWNNKKYETLNILGAETLECREIKGILKVPWKDKD